MTEGVISVEKDTSVKEAAAIMRENDIRGLVVTEDGEAVGIVAGKDLLYEVVAEDMRPSDITVEDVMTTHLVTAHPHDDVSEIAKAMIENNISRIPIMQGEKLVGIVTHTNIMTTWPGYVDLMEERFSAGQV